MGFKNIRGSYAQLSRRKTRTLFQAFTLAAAVTGMALTAQAQNTMTSLVNELDHAGFGFYNLSVFGGYVQSSVPAVDATGALSDYGFHSWTAGVSASIGWRAKNTEKLHFNVRYSPSYYYQNSTTGFHASRFTPNQNASLSWGQTLGQKWTMSASLMVAVSEYNQLLLLSDPNQIFSGLPGSPGEYASAALTGTGANSGLNAAANAQSAIIAGQQNLLYGNRLLTAAAGMSVGYMISPRLRINGAFTGARMQHLDDNADPQSNYLLQQSTSLSGALSATYQLSERASINGSASYSRALSSLYSTPSVSIMAGFGYRLTEHMFIRASAGTGYLLPTNQGPNSGFQRTQWEASAGFGYRLLRHSFMASASRTVSDAFGLGAVANVYASGGWTWSPLGSSYGFTAGAAEQRLVGTGYGREGYRVMVGFTHSVKRRAFMNLSYGYGFGNSLLLAGAGVVTAPFDSSSHSVRLTIGIRPYLGSPVGAIPLPIGGGIPTP